MAGGDGREGGVSVADNGGGQVLVIESGIGGQVLVWSTGTWAVTHDQMVYHQVRVWSRGFTPARWLGPSVHGPGPAD